MILTSGGRGMGYLGDRVVAAAAAHNADARPHAAGIVDELGNGGARNGNPTC